MRQIECILLALSGGKKINKNTFYKTKDIFNFFPLIVYHENVRRSMIIYFVLRIRPIVRSKVYILCKSQLSEVSTRKFCMFKTCCPL